MDIKTLLNNFSEVDISDNYELDFIKVKLKHNEGLKAYQKILFQGAIAIVSGVFAYLNGITVFHIPFTKSMVNIPFFFREKFHGALSDGFHVDLLLCRYHLR